MQTICDVFQASWFYNNNMVWRCKCPQSESIMTHNNTQLHEVRQTPDSRVYSEDYKTGTRGFISWSTSTRVANCMCSFSKTTVFVFYRRNTVTHPRSFFIYDFSAEEKSWSICPKMNTIVFNKLSSQVLFEEKAKAVEMSSRNYLEVIDGQHPDLLSSNQTIRDNQAIRHRRSGYVQLMGSMCVNMWIN